jgi:hypothetical protein
MPHAYLPEKYKIEDAIPLYSKNIRVPIITLDEFKIGEKIIDNKGKQLTVKISPDIEGIEMTEYYFKYIEDIFFQKFYDNDNICKSEIIRNNPAYRIILCDKRFKVNDIKSFPDISIIKDKEYNFSITFSGEDLFYFKDDNYYFKIVSVLLEQDIFLGRILFKKYLTILNPDTKQVYFYFGKEEQKKDGQIIPKGNESQEESEDSKTIIIIIACVVGGIIFFGAGIYIGTKIIKKRMKKAYELNDDYDYKPNTNNNEEFSCNS